MNGRFRLPARRRGTGDDGKYVADFQFRVDSIAGVLLVALAGRLDPSACQQLDDCLEQAVRGRRAVVVDLSAAENLPRRAIDALVTARSGLGVRLRVVVPRGEPAHAALRAAGVLHTLTVHSSGPAALAAAQQR
jgi:anti-anti-sigma regulatory factor